MRRLLAVAWALLLIAGATTVPTTAALAMSCCEVLAPTSKGGCTDPSCVTSCFSTPDKAACDAAKNKISASTDIQWNSGSCWGLPECKGRVATGCCVVTSGDTTTCYASPKSEVCTQTPGQPNSGKFVGSACTTVKECEGRLEPGLAGAVGAAPTTTAETPSPLRNVRYQTPALQVKIPGLSFSAIKVTDAGGVKYLDIPFIAQYIQAVYNYVLGAVTVLAAAMMVWGGIKWATAGGSMEQVGIAKRNIQNAVIGVFIALGSYLILYTVNPDLVDLQSLQIGGVEQIAGTFSAPAGEGGPAGKTNADDIAEGAKMAGADPCAVLAFCEHESGLRFTWNGYPNNPKENAAFFGPCSAGADYLLDGGAFDKRLRAKFPGIWPPLGTDLPKGPGVTRYQRVQQKIDVILSNGVVDGYLAASYAKANVDSVVGAGIGSANLKRWRQANSCSGKNLTLAQAAAMGAAAAFEQACIPYAAVGNGGGGCPGSAQNCSPIDPAKFKKTKGYEISKGGQINGTCTGDGGKSCFTIWSQDQLRYILAAYARFDAKYRCTAGLKK